MGQQQSIKAIGKYIRIAPNKVRRVLNLIRGRSYNEALMILAFMPYRSCDPIWQVLDSAAANAQHNLGFEKQNLIVKTVFADQGPSLRRPRLRAKGQTYYIHKPTCHITVILEKRS